MFLNRAETVGLLTCYCVLVALGTYWWAGSNLLAAMFILPLVASAVALVTVAPYELLMIHRRGL